jgi:hypothetical protein
LIVIFTGMLAVATLLLVVVGWLQYSTLEKTDKTLRAGQRSFVFLKEVKPYQLGSGDHTEWYFLLTWENNGTTQTRNLTIKVSCERPYDFKYQFSTALGPKQTKVMAAALCRRTHWKNSIPTNAIYL